MCSMLAMHIVIKKTEHDIECYLKLMLHVRHLDTLECMVIEDNIKDMVLYTKEEQLQEMIKKCNDYFNDMDDQARSYEEGIEKLKVRLKQVQALKESGEKLKERCFQVMNEFVKERCIEKTPYEQRARRIRQAIDMGIRYDYFLNDFMQALRQDFVKNDVLKVKQSREVCQAMIGWIERFVCDRSQYVWTKKKGYATIREWPCAGDQVLPAYYDKGIEGVKVIYGLCK